MIARTHDARTHARTHARCHNYRQEGELKTAIEQLARENNFPLKKLFVVDGSTRSSHRYVFYFIFYSLFFILFFIFYL